MNPNKYIVVILADRRFFWSEKWGDFLIAAGNPRTYTTYPEVNAFRLNLTKA